MNFILVDPALKREVGYHASICHYLVPKLKTFGIKPMICSNLKGSPALATSLDSEPLFRYSSADLSCVDDRSNTDSCTGYIDHFNFLWQAIQEDLTRLQNISAADCVYVNAAGPVELKAVLEWMMTFSPKTRPRVIVQLEKPPRLNAQLLYRFGIQTPLRSMSDQPSSESLLKLIAFDPAVAKFYEGELSYPVEVWPFPQEAIAGRPNKGTQRSHTVAVLGRQTREKGFAVIPELASVLLADENSLLLVHNNAPDEMPDEQAQLREIARNNKRLILSESVVRSDVWRQFLGVADVLLCPDPMHRLQCPVLNEAIANGIPAVVPAASPMSELLEKFGNPGETFAEDGARSIHEALKRILANYDHYAELARDASVSWKATQGAGRIAGNLLSWYPPPSPVSYAQNVAGSLPRRDTRVNTVPSLGKSRPKRVLVSWYCDPSYIPPPIFSEKQVTVGPHPLATVRTYLAPNERKRYDAYTPYKSLYDIKEVLESQGVRGPFDAVIVFTESTLNNLPHNVEAFGCPTVFFVGDTHHSEGAIKNMVQYATKARFDYVVSTYNRQHMHWYAEAGKERVAWIPGLSVQHIPQRFMSKPVRKRQLAFVGQVHNPMHQRRARLVGALREAEIPVEFKMVSRAEAANLYSSSVLSFNASLNGDLNLRTFEVMSAGGCLVTDRLSVESGQSTLFEEGRDYLGYSSVDELTGTVNQYLNRPEEALKIAASGNKEYLQRFLPETQAQVLLNWVLSGDLPSEYSSTGDIRPRVAALSSVPLLRRIEIYETLQEAHQIPEEIRVVVSSGVPLCIVADMIDLPRVRCSILKPDHAIESLLKQFELAGRVAVIDSPEQAASLGPWDFVIAQTSDHPSVRNIPHRQYLEVETDDAASARLAG